MVAVAVVAVALLVVVKVMDNVITDQAVLHHDWYDIDSSEASLDGEVIVRFRRDNPQGQYPSINIKSAREGSPESVISQLSKCDQQLTPTFSDHDNKIFLLRDRENFGSQRSMTTTVGVKSLQLPAKSSAQQSRSDRDLQRGLQNKNNDDTGSIHSNSAIAGSTEPPTLDESLDTSRARNMDNENNCRYGGKHTRHARNYQQLILHQKVVV